MWRELKGFDGQYRVNDDGDFQSFRHGKWRKLKIGIARSGIVFVWLKRLDGKMTQANATRIIWETFCGPVKTEERVVHRNGIKIDLRVENLAKLPIKKASALGSRSQRIPVEKYDRIGRTVCFYKSAKVAGKANHMSEAAVRNRCLGKVKHPFKEYDFSFRYEEG